MFKKFIGLFMLLFVIMINAEEVKIKLNSTSATLPLIEKLLNDNSPKTYARYPNDEEYFTKGLVSNFAWLCSLHLLGKEYLLAIDTQNKQETTYSILRLIDSEKKDFSQAEKKLLKKWQQTSEVLQNYFLLPLEIQGKKVELIGKIEWIVRNSQDPRPPRCLVTYEVLNLYGNSFSLDNKEWIILLGKAWKEQRQVKSLPILIIPYVNKSLDYHKIIQINLKQSFLLNEKFFKAKILDRENILIEKLDLIPCKLTIKSDKYYRSMVCLERDKKKYFVTSNNQNLQCPNGDYEILYGVILSNKDDSQYWVTPPLGEEVVGISENKEFNLGEKVFINVEYQKLDNEGKVFSVVPRIRTEFNWKVYRILTNKKQLPKLKLTVRDLANKILYSRYFEYKRNEVQPLNVILNKDNEEVVMEITIEDVSLTFVSEKMNVICK